MKRSLLFWLLMSSILVIGCSKSPTDSNGNGDGPDPDDPFWEQVYETSSTGMHVDENGDILLATLDATGITPIVARSSDNGDTWNTIMSGHGTSYLAISPDGDFYVSGFRSLDNGATWEEIGLRRINSMDFTSYGYIFASARDDGLFRSGDKGNSWVEMGFSNTEYNNVFVDVDQEDRIAVGFMYGICFSTDNGNTWSDTTLNEHVYSLAVNSLGHIFTGYGDKKFAISTDDGETWTSQEIKNEINVTVAIDQIVIGPHDEILLNSVRRIFLSEDHGSTWTRVCEGITPAVTDYPYFTGMGISPNGHILVSSHSGVWRSIDPLEGY